MDLNKNDKVKIISGGKPFEGLIGTVIDFNKTEVKVRLTLNKNQENQRIVTNIFNKSDVELITEESFLNENKKGDNNMKLVLTEQELKAWCSDNDAQLVYDALNDDWVNVKGYLNEDLGAYNFTTNELYLNDSSDDLTPVEQNTEEDFIHDYVYDVNIDDEKDELPSWEFIGKIASAENLEDNIVWDKAVKLKYNIFEIAAPNFDKFVVAAKGVTKEDIYNDFADYLEGSATVTEVKIK